MYIRNGTFVWVKRGKKKTLLMSNHCTCASSELWHSPVVILKSWLTSPPWRTGRWLAPAGSGKSTKPDTDVGVSTWLLNCFTTTTGKCGNSFSLPQWAVNFLTMPSGPTGAAGLCCARSRWCVREAALMSSRSSGSSRVGAPPVNRPSWAWSWSWWREIHSHPCRWRWSTLTP